MSRPRRLIARVSVALGALVVLAVLAWAAGVDVALELAPAVLLAAAALAGWLPGEERLLRSIRRALRHARGGLEPLVPRGPRETGRARRYAGGVRAPRGPPRPAPR